MRRGILILAVVCLTGTTRATQDLRQLPQWLRDFIAAREQQPVSEPAVIVRYNYKGEAVYFYPSRCCDIPSRLFGADGRILCAPDGGFVGVGDGRCPDFARARTNETVVWRDRRGAPPRQTPVELSQRWTRSTEEERPGEDVQVFRPAGSRTFPPSRFRMVYEFRSNGECTWLALAPNDAQEMRRGTWSFDPVDSDMIRIVQSETVSRFRILELTTQVLKLRPVLTR